MSRRTHPAQAVGRGPRLSGVMRRNITAQMRLLEAHELTDREREAWAMYGVLSHWTARGEVVIKPGPGLATFLYVPVF